MVLFSKIWPQKSKLFSQVPVASIKMKIGQNLYISIIKLFMGAEYLYRCTSDLGKKFFVIFSISYKTQFSPERYIEL